MTSPEKGKKPSTPERASTFLRNINAVGAVAFIGAGLVLSSGVLIGLGAIDAVCCSSWIL